MVKILHFADAHIDMANYGRHDPETGLPLRVLDFLKSLDTIIDAAIDETVDLVLFAGDAYKDRTPAPTFQREWGKRIMRLSRANIPTLLLIGNHDISPAVGRAHAVQEYDTLQVPHVRVAARPELLRPADLDNLPVQIIALPWVPRSGLLANLGITANDPGEVYAELESRLVTLINNYLDETDPNLPVVLTAHCSVQGATFGGERAVMLGGDLVLSGSVVRDPRLDYVALGHIHKPQNLNEGLHPPVIYPGSIERVDFGEVGDDKFFVIAEVERGHTRVTWHKLDGVRPFVDRYLKLESSEGMTEKLIAALPPADKLEGAIVRLTVAYQREWEPMLDETPLREHAAAAFEFRLVKRPNIEARARLPGDRNISSYSSLDLLDLFWRANHTEPGESEALKKLADALIHGAPPEDGQD